MTIVYETNGGDGTDSDCTPAVGTNEKLLEIRDSTGNTGRTVPSLASNEISWSWTTEANNPNSINWPTAIPGNPYKASLNFSGMYVTITVTFEIHRVNSSCTSQGSISSGSFAGSGVHTYVNESWNPASGAITDRAQFRVLASNSDPTMDRVMAATHNSADSYVQGPWIPPSAPTQPGAVKKLFNVLVRR